MYYFHISEDKIPVAMKGKNYVYHVNEQKEAQEGSLIFFSHKDALFCSFEMSHVAWDGP